MLSNEQKRKIKYLKSRSEIIQYKDFHEIKDNYKEYTYIKDAKSLTTVR